MKYVPHDYQAYATDFILTHPEAAVLLECGLGKTSITLTALNDMMFDRFEVHKVLIIAPIRVCRNSWAAEIEKWDHLKGMTYSLVLGSRDGVLDTLEWEGIREGADDIRYATKLKLLATEAMKHKSGDVQLLGRRAMSYLAYFDAEREDLNAFRLETINYIIQLQNALNGGK